MIFFFNNPTLSPVFSGNTRKRLVSLFGCIYHKKSSVIHWDQHGRRSHEPLTKLADGIGTEPKTSPSPPWALSPSTVNFGRLIVSEAVFPSSNVSWAWPVELQNFLHDTHGYQMSVWRNSFPVTWFKRHDGRGVGMMLHSHFFFLQRTERHLCNSKVSAESPSPSLPPAHAHFQKYCGVYIWLSCKVINGKKLKFHARKRLPG